MKVPSASLFRPRRPARRLRALRSVALTVGLTLAGTGVSATVSPLAAGAQSVDRDPAALEATFVSRVNQLRSSQGLTPFAADAEIRPVAQAWTEKMADAGRISHNPDLGRQVTAPWRKLGENVGTGGDAESVEDAFETSPGHRKNILDPEFTSIAITVVIRGERIYVTQQFRRADTPASTVAPAAAVTPPNELALAVPPVASVAPLVTKSSKAKSKTRTRTASKSSSRRSV